WATAPRSGWTDGPSPTSPSSKPRASTAGAPHPATPRSRPGARESIGCASNGTPTPASPTPASGSGYSGWADLALQDARTLLEQPPEGGVVDDGDAQLLGLLGLRGPGRVSHDQSRRLPGHRARHLPTLGFDGGLRLLPAHAVQRPRDHERRTCEQVGHRLLGPLVLETDTGRSQLLHQTAVGLVLGPRPHLGGDGRADPLHLGDLLLGGVHQRRKASEVPDQGARHRGTDVTDAECG